MNIFIFITICALVALVLALCGWVIIEMVLCDGDRFVRTVAEDLGARLALRDERCEPSIRPRHA